MTYSIKEIFYTLQGEGANAGRPAVFCRFTGCNLWTGREADRSSAVCRFCDTDFVGTDGAGGGKFATSAALVAAIEKQWPDGDDQHRFVVLTGGEPLLQVDATLIDALHGARFAVAVETNGSGRGTRALVICLASLYDSPLRMSVVVVKAAAVLLCDPTALHQE